MGVVYIDPFVLARRQGSIFTPSGVYIGNMTTGTGLADHFDGNTNDTGGYTTTKPAWSGMTITERVWKAVVWSVSVQGFIQDANPTDTRITLYGKQGTAPSSATDGTALGNTGDFTDGTTNISKEILSDDVETEWDHLWIVITATGGVERRCAEIQLYESI